MDDSTIFSTVPFNVNRAEEALLEDAAKRKRQVQELIDQHDFSDDEEESSESEDESDSERLSVSDNQGTSMPNSNDSQDFHRPACRNNYAEQSNHTDPSQHIGDSQLNGSDSSNGQCQHSYHFQEASEVPLYVEGGQTENQDMDGHSSISDSPEHDEPQENSSANGDVSEEKYPVNGSSLYVEIARLQENCRRLELQYEAKCKELKQVKHSELTRQNDAEQQNRILEQKLELINADKEGLLEHLQSVKNLVSDFESKNKALLVQVASLEKQLGDAIEAKHEALAELESSELTVHSLEKQLKECQRTENLSRVHVQNDRILGDIKIRHQKEVLQYKENIDDLKKQLAAKMQFADNLNEKHLELQQSYDKMREEKNKLLSEIEKIRGDYNRLLKKDTVEELNSLNVQVQRLQDENRTMHKQKKDLEEDIKTLKAELKDSETLRKLPLSTKSNQSQECSDGRQTDLKQELENSLINARNLRLENSDLKKQLKDSENEQAQKLERLKFYKQRLEKSEEKAKYLEEKLKSLAIIEPIPKSYEENKIKSLKEELRLLRIDFLDVTKKLKEATANEVFLRAHNEELTKKIGEMMKEHSEEKQKSVEECREKCLKLHENVLSKEKERMAAKAEEELRDACSKYENKIASLQRRNSALSDKLFELRTQNAALQQDNQNLLRKLDKVPVPKDREEVEKELRSDYERQLKQLKEHLIKEKDEYLEKCLKAETERAQIEWANKKMIDIKNYIETTKQRLDEEFQKCLEKERNNFNHVLNTEKRKFEDELQNLRIQHDKEKSEQSSQLKKDLQSKLLNERAVLKENYEKEAKHTQQEMEYKLALAQREIEYLKEKLSSRQEAQQEIEKIKQDYLQKQMLFEQEKALILSSKAELNENLKSLAETENRHCYKLLKYEKYTAAIKKKHAEEVTLLQNKLSHLQKSYEEAQNQLKEQLVKFSEKFRKTSTSSGTQTEEEMVAKNIASSMETKFFKCLESISDEVRLYLEKSNARKAERFQSSLQLYHQQMNSKNLQDISNDIRSLTPAIIFPRARTTSVTSDNSRYAYASSQNFCNSKVTSVQDFPNDKLSNSQDFHNGKFTTSTPGFFLPSNKQQVPLEIATNRNFATRKYNSSPNLNVQTKPRTVSSFGQNSDLFKNYFTTIHKNGTPAVDPMGLGDVPSFPKTVAFSNGHSLQKNGKHIESVDELGDISYDFIPTNLPADVSGPGKFQNGGLFGTGNF